MLNGSLAGNHFVVVASAFPILDRNRQKQEKAQDPCAFFGTCFAIRTFR